MSSPSSKGLANLVAELHQENKAWHPCGLNTRMHWGPTINENSLAISTREISGVINHAVDDLTITVEAGLSLAELQAILAAKGQWLSVDWPWGSAPNSDSKNTGSIGGLIARGLSGSLRHRHLGVRDQVIGIGAIRSDGIEAHAGGQVVKNVAGYDLMRLLCGSWGSLALITELTLRTQPIKPAHAQLTIKGSLTNLEALSNQLIISSFTPEYIDWRKELTQEWYFNIGLASVSNLSLKEQLAGITKLAEENQLTAESKEWNGPLINDFSQELVSQGIKWLVRVTIPPAKVKELIKSEEFKCVDSWQWIFGAGTGIGQGWQNNPKQPNILCSAMEMKALRTKIQQLEGEMIILMQPFEKAKRIEAWLDAPSMHLVKAIKKNFDPKNQISIGRLPGVRG